MDQAVAVVAAGRAEHRAHVLGRERGVPDDQALEVRRQPGDLVDHPLPHLGLHLAVARTASPRSGTTARTPTRRACRRAPAPGSLHGRDLQGDRRVGGHDAAPAVLPLLLQLLRSAENADVGLHLGVVEQLVGRRELRHPVQREVHLQIAAAVVDAREALADVGGQRGRVDQAVDRQVGRDAGDDDRRGDRRAVLESNPGDAAVGHQDLVDLAAQPQLAAVGREQLLQMRW